MRTFTVNGVTYTASPFDFNMVCELEDRGISLEDAQTKPMSLIRAYFSISANLSKAVAGAQMQAHLIAGGNFDELSDVIAKEMDESDFFQALSADKEKKTPKAQSKTK